MSFPLAAGGAIFPAGSASPTPPYSGTFIPEIWSGKLLEKFYANTVLAAISNTDYEGEIKKHGDKVIIRQRPTIDIRDYAANQQLVVDRPSAGVLTLMIDKGKYFNLILDDVMRVQSDINLMSLFSDDAAEQMKIRIDAEVLLSLIGKAAAANRGVAAGAISASINLGATTTPLSIVPRAPATGEVEIVDLIVRMGQVLDEQNIPGTDRYLIVPSWVASMIKRSELRDASLTGDGASILRNGRIGSVDRFTIYVSNLLPSGTAAGLASGEFAMFAGHRHALTFATQLTQVETLKSESTFGTLLRGLQVFGHGVLEPKALVQAIVAQ